MLRILLSSLTVATMILLLKLQPMVDGIAKLQVSFSGLNMTYIFQKSMNSAFE